MQRNHTTSYHCTPTKATVSLKSSIDNRHTLATILHQLVPTIMQDRWQPQTLQLNDQRKGLGGGALDGEQV